MKELQWLLQNGWVVREFSLHNSPEYPRFYSVDWWCNTGGKYIDLWLFKVNSFDEMRHKVGISSEDQAKAIVKLVNHSLSSY